MEVFKVLPVSGDGLGFAAVEKSSQQAGGSGVEDKIGLGSRLIERWSVIGSFAKNHPMGQQDTCYVHESSRCNSCRFARNYQEIKLRYGDPRLLEGVERVPKELWDALGSENRTNFDKLQNEIDKYKVDLQKETELFLEAVSKSEDDVSQALQTIFAQAVRATEPEIQNAIRRKERGNPPGKLNDPLGDQINWEQLLSHCAGKNKIWIITSDKDYFTRCGERRFLNALLLDELKKNGGPSVEVYCFDGILTGIEHFVKTTNAAAQKLPPHQKAEEIDRKLIASDYSRGVDSGMVVPFLMSSGQLPQIPGATLAPFPYGFQQSSGSLLDWSPLNEASGYFSPPYQTFLYLNDDGDGKVTVSHAPIAGGGRQTMFRIQSASPIVPPTGTLPSKDFFDWLINLPAGTRRTSFTCW